MPRVCVNYISKRQATNQTNGLHQEESLANIWTKFLTMTMPSTSFEVLKGKINEYPALFKLTNYTLCLLTSIVPAEQFLAQFV